MKTTVIYITIVGILFLMLLGVLKIGEKLVAPDNFSGMWELSSNFIETDQESCTSNFMPKKNYKVAIEQSGVYLTITFNDRAKTKMRGVYQNDKMIFEKLLPANDTSKNDCGIETATELEIEPEKKEGMPDHLTGTWINPGCSGCNVIHFSAVKQKAKG